MVYMWSLIGKGMMMVIGVDWTCFLPSMNQYCNALDLDWFAPNANVSLPCRFCIQLDLREPFG